MMHFVIQILLKCIIIHFINSRQMLSVLASDFAQGQLSSTMDKREVSLSENFRKLLLRHRHDKPSSPHDLDRSANRATTLLNMIPEMVTPVELVKAAHVPRHLTSKRNALTTARNIWRGISFPYKTTLIMQNPVWNRDDHSTDVLIGPQATVLSTLMDAARTFIRTHGNLENPYNVHLLWDDILNCYVINGAIRIWNSPSQKWRITVESRNKQIIYNASCLPFNVILRPDSVIIISFLSTTELQ